MSTQHTPGPYHIGMKPGPILYGPKGEQIADMRCGELLMPEEAKSNRALLRAAPDLLAALDDLVREIDESTHEDGNKRAASYVRGEVCYQSTLEGARAAIAKAKGGGV